MATKWIKSMYPGVRYREHTTRQHNGQPDRYFTIYYKLKGKLHEEKIGWASEGWNAKKASIELNRLKQAHTTGEGPQTLSEKRARFDEKREADNAQKAQDAKDNLSLAVFFTATYFPQAKIDKSSKSYKREEQLFRLWIEPTIGSKSFKSISVQDIETIKKKMLDAGSSPRTIQYALAVVRQIFNRAKHCSLFSGDCPTTKVKTPKIDNRRQRFLTKDEAGKILEKAKARNPRLYEICMMSLKTGARANEILSIKWGDVDFGKEMITLWDTKNSKTRVVFMTDEIKSLLKGKDKGISTDYIFPGKNGNKTHEVSRIFNDIVKELGLNSETSDARQKVVFHTLRHTFASWLVENGIDLYTVKELMGHATLSMTERYAHLGNGTLQKAVKQIDKLVVGTGNSAHLKESN